ncbi:PRC-barrel domain-containing protein [Phyllobacterium leguminum]|uniref:PRC-barrel domain protein n=1 Tax=Phyllobacterium leguminum TaxID=314237 RepID=A0A318SY81_9HYPH|nr:PRC-barrel domain-containing protein [Phyllobacterium leguminum]PYE86352.1 PRC-barrel domain protein [Phyllobacterium leguminum]
MLTRLLGTTAAIAMLSTASFAQTTEQAPQLQETPPAQTSDLFTYPTEIAPKIAPGTQNLSAANGKVLASGMIGQAVYDGPTSDAQRIGEINDIVIGENGVAQAAVIGVGGFLGVGQKDVAVGLDHLGLATRPNGEQWLVADVSKDDLNNAPAFERSQLFTRGILNQNRAADSANGTTGGPSSAPVQQ